MEESKVLLHDDDAEKYVVGGLLNNAELYWSVADRLKPGLFSNSKLARTVRCIIEIFKKGVITIGNGFKPNCRDYLTALITVVVTAICAFIETMKKNNP